MRKDDLFEKDKKSVLIVEGLTCKRAHRVILRQLSFRVKAGEAFIITGRNGVGKSTLLAALSGHLLPFSGSVRWVGSIEDDTHLAECHHFIGHKDGLKSALTVEDNLSFAQSVLGNAMLSPFEALKIFGLIHARLIPVAYLSAGQRRRVALARLLVAYRPLWLLDEPVSALDQSAQELFTKVMRQHLAKGGLIVAATHAPLGLDNAATLNLTWEMSLDPEATAKAFNAEEA
jgi:heme exporter protein A